MLPEPEPYLTSAMTMELMPKPVIPIQPATDHIPQTPLEAEQLDMKPPMHLSPIDAQDELDEQDEYDDEDIKVKISTSPLSSASASLLPGPHPSISRRPTRKSTLTQQQKNSRRQRATADQLTLLEIEFNKNPTPTATVREKVAQEINMTERSVQIWFQNRRAKIKNLAKKSAETGEECDAIPESMRRYLALQAMESGKSFSGAEFFGNGSMNPFPGGPLADSGSQASKLMIHHITCRSLGIGAWHRVGQTQMDLVVFYCPAKSMMTYYIQADNVGFRIEYPFSYIKDITLDTGDVSASAEGACQQPASIVIELHHPPIFTTDQGSRGWLHCADFTEGHQASQVLFHHLGGHAKVLSTQMAKLVSLDAYRMRHNTFETSAVMSAPVSPTLANRPASQPNHLVHPHMGMLHQGGPNLNMGPPAPRGHKRQRSRSVPVAIDLSQLRQPMPDFMVHHQHQHQHHHVHHHNQLAHGPHTPNHIFAPVPQHAAQLPYHHPSPMFGGVSGSLSVETAAFRFDFAPPGPPSATTATTPPSSEFESSIFHSKGSGPDCLSAPQAHTPYDGPFLSPMADPGHMLDPSVSPLSALDHSELQVPDGASQYIHRSASADPATYQHNERAMNFGSEALIPRDKPFVFDTESMFDDKNALDALLIDDPLIDPFSKQPLSLPFRTPLDDLQPLHALSQDLEPMHHHHHSSRSRPGSDDFEFHHLITLDPSSLTPEIEKPAFIAS